MTNNEVLDYISIIFGLDLEKNISNNYNLEDDLKFIKKIVKKLDIKLGPEIIKVLLGVEVNSIKDVFYIKNTYGMIEYKSKSENIIAKQKELISILNGTDTDKINNTEVKLIQCYVELNSIIRKEIMQEDSMTYTEKKRYMNDRYVFVMRNEKRILWNYDYILYEYIKDNYKTSSKWIGKTNGFNVKELENVINLRECLLILTK